MEVRKLIIISVLFVSCAAIADADNKAPSNYSNYSEWQTLEQYFDKLESQKRPQKKSTAAKQDKSTSSDQSKEKTEKDAEKQKGDEEEKHRQVHYKKLGETHTPFDSRGERKPINITQRPVFDYRLNNTAPILAHLSPKDRDSNRHLKIILSQEDYSRLFFSAVINNNIQAADSLITKGADINAYDRDNKYTPLMYATYYGDYSMAKYLIAKGADINLQNMHGQTAAHIAAIKHHYITLNYLINAGSNPFILDKADNAVFDYINYRHIHSRPTALLYGFSSPNEALLYYTKHNMTDAAISVLQYYDADPNIIQSGQTAFMYAVNNNNYSLLNYMLSNSKVAFNSAIHIKFLQTHTIKSHEIGYLLATAVIKRRMEKPFVFEGSGNRIDNIRPSQRFWQASGDALNGSTTPVSTEIIPEVRAY